MENKVKDIIIKALEEAGYEVEIDNGTLIVDNYDTNNVVSVNVKTYLNSRPHTIFGRNIQTFCLNSIGRRKSFGLTDILLVV